MSSRSRSSRVPPEPVLLEPLPEPVGGRDTFGPSRQEQDELERRASAEDAAFWKSIQNKAGAVDFRIVHRRYVRLLEADLRSWRPAIDEKIVRRITSPLRRADAGRFPVQRRAFRLLDSERLRHRRARPFAATREVELVNQQLGEGASADYGTLENMIRRRADARLDKRSAWELMEVYRGRRGYGRWSKKNFEKFLEAAYRSHLGARGGAKAGRGRPLKTSDRVRRWRTPAETKIEVLVSKNPALLRPGHVSRIVRLLRTGEYPIHTSRRVVARYLRTMARPAQV